MGFEVTTELLLLLLAAAFLAGFIDSIAGGGGLITVPVLLLAARTRSRRFRPTRCRASSDQGRRLCPMRRRGMSICGGNRAAR